VKSEAAVLQGSTRKRHRFEISLLRYQLSTTGDVTSLRLPFAFLKSVSSMAEIHQLTVQFRLPQM
jgi:predicted DNA-binding ribbon-helix-helix protein